MLSENADRREAGYSERQIIEDFGAPYDAAQRILLNIYDSREEDIEEDCHQKCKQRNCKNNAKQHKHPSIIFSWLWHWIFIFRGTICLNKIRVLLSIGGLCAIGFGIFEMFSNFASGLFTVGEGLIVLGISIILIPLLIKLVKLMWKLFKNQSLAF